MEKEEEEVFFYRLLRDAVLFANFSWGSEKEGKTKDIFVYVGFFGWMKILLCFQTEN